MIKEIYVCNNCKGEDNDPSYVIPVELHLDKGGCLHQFIRMHLCVDCMDFYGKHIDALLAIDAEKYIDKKVF